MNSGWKFNSSSSRNQLLKQSNVTSEYLEKEMKEECSSSSNDMDTLLLNNAATPARIEGSIVRPESVKC